MQTITYTATSFLYANTSPVEAILLSPRISLAKHVCLPKRALCICLHGVQRKALSSLTHVWCSTFLVFWTKRSQDGIIVSQDLTSHSYTARWGGGGWPRGAMLQLKVKRGTCPERESCFAFFLHETLSYALLILLSLAMLVLIDFGCLFEDVYRCQQHIPYSHIS